MGIAQTANGTANGISFLVAAGIVYEIVAACCSSPQTAQINAATRAGTLMKWVNLGLVQAGFFVAAAAACDRKHAGPILAGGGLAGGVMYLQYAHAISAGLASCEPGTES